MEVVCPLSLARMVEDMNDSSEGIACKCSSKCLILNALSGKQDFKSGEPSRIKALLLPEQWKALADLMHYNT